MKTTATILTLALIVAVTPAAAEQLELVLRYDSEQQRVLTRVPEQVQDFLDGVTGDPTGELTAFLEAYYAAARTHAFNSAIDELSELIVSLSQAEPLDTITIEAVVIPGILAERPDMVSALHGGGSTLSNPRCYKIEDGTPYCKIRTLWWCSEEGCNTQSGVGCTVTTPIQCPVGENGLTLDYLTAGY